MRIDQIESVLGPEIIDRMQAMLERAIVDSREAPETCAALIDLLLAQVASVIDVSTDQDLCVERAADCAKRLVRLVEAMAEIKRSAHDKIEEFGPTELPATQQRGADRPRLN